MTLSLIMTLGILLTMNTWVWDIWLGRRRGYRWRWVMRRRAICCSITYHRNRITPVKRVATLASSTFSGGRVKSRALTIIPVYRIASTMAASILSGSRVWRRSILMR